MSKGTYSATQFQVWFSGRRRHKLTGQHLIVGVDVGKLAFYACLMTSSSGPYEVLYFERHEIPEFVESLASLDFEEVSIVVEPTGTYGDVLIDQARQAGFAIERINGAQVNAARNAFDGVKSLHDGKSAHLLATLYFFKASREWRDFDPELADLRAMYDLDRHLARLDELFLGPLEARIARHWPELTNYLSLGSATLLELLSEYGGPRQVAENATEAAQLMRRTGRGQLKAEKIQAVIASAKAPMTREMREEERVVLKYLASTLREHQRKTREIRALQEKVIREHEYTRDLASFVGVRTALVLVALLGPLTNYDSVEKLEKAAGLMLQSKSSGLTAEARHGNPERMKISKRGPGHVRGVLFLFVMRLLKDPESGGCPYTRAWYEQRLARNGGYGMKGLTALMRKMVRAVWWVARGEEYDGRKLFDVKRLQRAGFLANG